MARVVFAALAPGLLTLAGCGAAALGGSAKLSDQETLNILTDIGSTLSMRQFRNPWNGNMLQCSDFFTIGDITLTDTALMGDTGKVRISVPVTYKSTQPFQRHDACYGAPTGGWSPSQTAGWQEEFKLEHWKSGWRLAANQGPSFGN